MEGAHPGKKAEDFGFVLADPGMRFVARIVDGVILWIGSFILGALGIFSLFGLGGLDGEPGALAIGGFLSFIIGIAIAALLYEVVLIAVYGQTVGKMLTKIKVIRADTGEVPGWGKSAVRWVVPAVLGIIPIVGWILLIICYGALLLDEDQRRGWHDRAAGTRVVKIRPAA